MLSGFCGPGSGWSNSHNKLTPQHDHGGECEPQTDPAGGSVAHLENGDEMDVTKTKRCLLCVGCQMATLSPLQLVISPSGPLFRFFAICVRKIGRPGQWWRDYYGVRGVPASGGNKHT